MAERLLEKEVLDGGEVAAMVKAYREGRPFADVCRPPVVLPTAPTGGAMTAKEKPKPAEEENPVPGSPQTILA